MTLDDGIDRTMHYMPRAGNDNNNNNNNNAFISIVDSLQRTIISG